MEDNREVFPQDVQNEILLRLPVKSLGKCICVSKKWAAIIREKYFRDRYFLQSMTRPRLLFVFLLGDDWNVLFQSVYQEKEPLLSSGQQQTLVNLKTESHVCAVLRGLICIKSAFKIMICNPGTKKFLSLPELGEHEVAFSRSYLGYDEAKDVFKVLCLTSKSVGNNTPAPMDYRVFTVGSGEECWRTLVYKPLHFPVTKGLCKDGVLYFGALSISNDDPIVMSFNLGSEELNVIELPQPIQIHKYDSSLVSYNGEIALVNRLGSVDENGEIKIWVRNEVAGEWREEHIVIPRWRETVGGIVIPRWRETVLSNDFCFKGTIGTGELVFALDGFIQGSIIVLYYDTITQHLRKFEIDGVPSDTFNYASTFLDHVDSLLLM